MTNTRLRQWTATGCVGIVAGLAGWREPFHLAVGLPVLAALGFVLHWWNGRTGVEPDGAEGADEEETERGRSIVAGGLVGCIALIILAGTFEAAARTRVYALFYDRDCPEILAQIAVLDGGRAYPRIVQLIDGRLTRKVSSVCRESLNAVKARTLMKWAEQLPGPERLSTLRHAKAMAENLTHTDLSELARVSLQSEELRQAIDATWQAQLAPLQTTRGLVLTFGDILFETGRATLTAGARTRVREVVGLLGRGTLHAKRISVEGHADATGRGTVNAHLAGARASAVADALVEAGFERGRLQTYAYGASRPVASNDTPAGRARNRRVELVILQD